MTGTKSSQPLKEIKYIKMDIKKQNTNNNLKSIKIKL